MSNRFFSTARFLLVVLALAVGAGVMQLSAQSTTPDRRAIFGLWLTTDPAGVSMLRVVAESADSSSIGIERPREPFAAIFRCSIENSWSDSGYRYYSVVSVSRVIEGAMPSFMHYLLRLSQDGQTLEIVRSSVERFSRSSATDLHNGDPVTYHRLSLAG
jgi:hypothetical protein